MPVKGDECEEDVPSPEKEIGDLLAMGTYLDYDWDL